MAYACRYQNLPRARIRRSGSRHGGDVRESSENAADANGIDVLKDVEEKQEEYTGHGRR